MAANKREEEAEETEIRTHSIRDDVENNPADSPDLKRPAPDERSTVFTESKQELLNIGIEKKLSLLLIPCALVIIALLVALNIPTAFEPPLVLPLMNTVFLGIIPIVIAYITFKVYTKSGSASVLLIGSGILIFGLGSIVAGWVNPLSGGPNMTVTIHNTCACIGSILILAGAIMSHTPAKSGRAIKNTGTIAAAYTAIVLFVTIFSLATLQGIIPPFFVPGSGPTVLRQVILENATALFALSSVLFMVAYRKGRSDFFFWYSVALALIAIGLLAVFVQPSVGSLIGWVGRSAQYIGFVFALYAVLVAKKTATAKGLPLEDVIGNFFVDAEQNYRQLVETATDAIVTFDEDYRVLLWNSAAERMFGYPRDEAIGASFLKLVIDDRYIAVIKNDEQDISGRDIPALTPVPVEIVGKRKDGALFPAELTISRRWQEGRLIHTCILRDITERKRAEEGLLRKNDELAANGEELKTQFDALTESERITRLSEERLIMAQEIGRTGSWEYNVQTGKIWGSEEGFHIYGFPPVAGDFPLDDIEACIPERERVHQALTDLITKGQEYNIECAINPADGSAQKIIHSIARLEKDEQGNPLRVVGVIHDITDIWQIEALRESETSYRGLFNTIWQAIYILNPDGTFVDVNEGAEAMYGYAREEFIGRTPEFLSAPGKNDLAAVMEYIKKAFAGKPQLFGFWGLRKGGEIFPKDVYLYKGTYFGKDVIIANGSDITERKKAEEAIRESEARFRSYFDMPLQGIAITSTEKGWLQVNNRICSMLGYTRDEIIRMTWTEITHPDDLAADVEQFNRLLSREIEQYTLEKRFIRKDGSEIWTKIAVGCVRKPDGNVDYIVAVMEDITNRKLAEEALVSAHERLNEAYHLAHIGTWDWIKETDTVTWSKELYNIAGRDPSLPAPTYAEHPRVYTPASWDRLSGAVTRTLTSGETYNLELELVRPDGSIRWVNAFGGVKRDGKSKVTGLHGTVQDITERKQVEVVLQESRELFATAFNSGPLMLAISDIDTGKYLNINETFTRFTGYSRDEAIGKNSVELGCIRPEDRDSLLQELKRTGRVAGKEFRLTKKDGESGWYLFFGEIIKVSGKNRLLSIAEDISERKQSEQTIQHALAEKEVLLREIHHRVKNNLAGIISLINLQTSSLTDPIQIYLFKDLETRIRSMALVHESLYQTKDIAHIRLATYTENLTRYLFQVYESVTNVRCRIDMGEITMPIETATPC